MAFPPKICKPNKRRLDQRRPPDPAEVRDECVDYVAQGQKRGVERPRPRRLPDPFPVGRVVRVATVRARPVEPYLRQVEEPVETRQE